MVSDNTLLARVNRAGEAESALKQLDPAFEAVISLYMKRMTEIASKEPWEGRKITSLAVAAKIAEEVRDFIKAIALDGPVAMDELKRLRKIEAMTPERRKVLGISLPS